MARDIGRASLAPRARLAAVLLPIYAAYILWSLVAHSHGRIGPVYCLGSHVLVQISDNLSYLFLPNKWVRKWPSLALLGALLMVSTVYSRRFRASLLSRKSALLIAAQLAALAPFSFSLLGNYYRFLYPAMALSTVWLFWLTDSLFEPGAARSRIGRRILVGFGLFLIGANLVNGFRRAGHEGSRGHEVARFVDELDQTLADHPRESVSIHIEPDVESIADTVVALGRLDRDRCLNAIPQTLAPRDVLLVGRYAWGKPLRIEILAGSAIAGLDDSKHRPLGEPAAVGNRSTRHFQSNAGQFRRQ